MNTLKRLKEDNNIIIITEDTLDPAKDIISSANRFTTKPKCILIMDSVNNPYFPVPYPRIDTYKVDLIKLQAEWTRLYGKLSSFLPWHYVIEMVEDEKYVVFVTRPLDLKFPMGDDGEWSNGVFTISDAITVLLVGDSSADIYCKRFYDVLGRLCIAPLVRVFRMLEQNVYTVNLDAKFKVENVTKFLYQR